MGCMSSPMRIFSKKREETKKGSAVEGKLDEKTLKESVEGLRLLMESAEDIIVVQDKEGKYLYYNETRFYDLKSEDVAGKHHMISGMRIKLERWLKKLKRSLKQA